MKTGPIGVYTPGSLYKRFTLSHAQRLNRQAFANRTDQIALAGSIIYGQKVAESQQVSMLAVQKMAQTRIQALVNLKV